MLLLEHVVSEGSGTIVITTEASKATAVTQFLLAFAG